LKRELVSSYSECRDIAEECLAISHLGLGYDTPGSEWLAFNPSLAQAIGWRNDSSRLFCWKLAGDILVESLWWTDSLPSQEMPFYRKTEVAEGWLVLASEKALRALEEAVGPLKRIGVLTREIYDQSRQRASETATFQEEWH
jgi:hypothetical protein